MSFFLYCHTLLIIPVILFLRATQDSFCLSSSLFWIFIVCRRYARRWGGMYVPPVRPSTVANSNTLQPSGSMGGGRYLSFLSSFSCCFFCSSSSLRFNSSSVGWAGVASLGTSGEGSFERGSLGYRRRLRRLYSVLTFLGSFSSSRTRFSLWIEKTTKQITIARENEKWSLDGLLKHYR